MVNVCFFDSPMGRSMAKLGRIEPFGAASSDGRNGWKADLRAIQARRRVIHWPNGHPGGLGSLIAGAPQIIGAALKVTETVNEH